MPNIEVATKSYVTYVVLLGVNEKNDKMPNSVIKLT